MLLTFNNMNNLKSLQADKARSRTLAGKQKLYFKFHLLAALQVYLQTCSKMSIRLRKRVFSF